jgi:hypothetical protein
MKMLGMAQAVRPQLPPGFGLGAFAYPEPPKNKVKAMFDTNLLLLEN